MKPIKLQNGLWAVSVPMYSDIEYKSKEMAVITTQGFNVLQFKFNFEMLGTVTQDSISFDVEPYINSKDLIINGKLQKKLFYDYQMCTDDIFEWYCLPSLSFRSLLSSKGLTDYEKLIILKEI